MKKLAFFIALVILLSGCKTAEVQTVDAKKSYVCIETELMREFYNQCIQYRDRLQEYEEEPEYSFNDRR